MKTTATFLHHTTSNRYWLLLWLILVAALHTRAQSTISFSADKTSGCVPLTVKFINTSDSSNVTSWRWDLGDGSTSRQASPVYVYTEGGSFILKLVVTYEDGRQDSVTRVGYINSGSVPIPNFKADTNRVCIPGTINFTDLTNYGGSAPGSITWDFGDGTTSNFQNPAKTYTFADSFNVLLAVVSNLGCSANVVKTNFIAGNPNPSAIFSYEPFQKCLPPVTVQFTNNSTGIAPLQYLWDFGNGTTSTEAAPNYTYRQSGAFSPSLTVTAANGCSNRQLIVNAINLGNMVSRITGPDNLCLTRPGLFANTNSTPSPLFSSWLVLPTSDPPVFGTVLTTTPPDTGTYQIQLINNYGNCLDTVYKTIRISPKLPAVSFEADKTRGVCIPFLVKFTNTTANTTGARFFWDFGDGATSTLEQPEHAYTQQGIFDITLTITLKEGCQTTITYVDYIIVQSPFFIPSSNFINGCAPHTTTFNAVVGAIVRPTAYIWNFGDNTPLDTSNESTNIHTYPLPGTYIVSVNALFDGGCTAGGLFSSPVLVGTKPSASFTFLPPQGCDSTFFRFTNTSINAQTFDWSFFGRQTSYSSSMVNPSMNFNDSGVVDIQLVAINNGCTDTTRLENQLYVTPPSASFFVSPVCGEANRKKRRFINTSIARENTRYTWDFGDGSTSTEPNPVHTYAAPGTYNILLVVKGDSCESSFERSVFIVDNFSFSTDNFTPCRLTPVTFTTGPGLFIDPTSIIWDFGDGNFDFPNGFANTTAVNAYTNAGVYTIKMVFANVNTNCVDTVTYKDYIRVNGPTANLSITDNRPAGCTGLRVSATAVPSPDTTFPIVKYEIDWGDGNRQTYTSIPFSHTYNTAGTFSIFFKVTDSRGCADSQYYFNVVNVSRLQANFFSSATLSCPKVPITFTNNSLSDRPPVNYKWQFGNGLTSNLSNPTIVYTDTGTYTIKLVATDAIGCTDSLIFPNSIRIVSPKSSFTISDTMLFCTPATVSFNFTGRNCIFHQWQLGDGSISQVPNPQKLYTDTGTYWIQHFATSPGGCQDTSMGRIKISSPIIGYNITHKDGCRPFNTVFESSSNGGDFYVWKFGDGNTAYSTGVSLTHTYNIIGPLKPQLFVVDAGGCTLPVQLNDTIKSYGTNPNFFASDTVACNNANVVLDASSSISYSGIASYKWSLGDGRTSTAANPRVLYNTTGAYSIQLIITTVENCLDTIAKTNYINVPPIPRPVITAIDKICVGVPVLFTAAITPPEAAPLRYLWTFSNGNQAVDSLPPAQTFGTAGQQWAKLLVVNSQFGCQDSTTKNIQVIAPPLPDFTSTNLCIDSVAVFNKNFNTVNDNIINYQWSINNQPQPFNLPQINFAVATAGNYQAELKVETASGCKANISKNFTVQKINPSIAADTLVGPGESFVMNSSADGDVTQYNWQPAALITNPAASSVVAKINTDQVFTATLTNNNGCKETAAIRITTFKEGPSILVPSAFTPNGLNPYLRPIVFGLRLQDFTIYNRYGQVVYQSNANNFRQGWNGELSGKPQPAGAYVWIARAKRTNGTLVVKKGTSILIR